MDRPFEYDGDCVPVTPDQTAFCDALRAVVAEHADKLSALELVAAMGHFVGVLGVAATSIPTGLVVQTLLENVKLGGQEALEGLRDAAKAAAFHDVPSAGSA